MLHTMVIQVYKHMSEDTFSKRSLKKGYSDAESKNESNKTARDENFYISVAQ